MARTPTKTNDTTANLGFEAKLWAAADALRNNMDAAEYKHVVLGLIFLKYISDAFEAKRAELEAQKAEGADPEDRDEYRASSIFWVPREARWQPSLSHAPAELNRRPTRRLAAAPKADVQEPQGDRAQALGTLFVRHTDQESPGACDRPDEAADRLEPDPVEAPALATAGDD